MGMSFKTMLLCVAGLFIGDSVTQAVDVSNWSAARPLPVSGYQYDAVEHNGYIYVIGGYTGEALDTAYYAKTNKHGRIGTWMDTTPLPEPDQGPGVTVWNGSVYVAHHNGNIYRAAIGPDGALGVWAQQPKAADWHGGRLLLEAYRGYLYLLGGNYYSTFFSSVYYARINDDGSLGAWNATTPMPEGRQHQSVHFHNQRVYIVGGITSVGDSGILSTAFSASVNCDGTLGLWRQEASLPHPLWYHNSVLADESIFVFGGLTRYSSGDVFEIYQGIIEPDGTIFEWADIGDVPANHPAGMGVVHVPLFDQTYLIGGCTDTCTDVTWTTAPPCATDLECEDGLLCTTDRCINGACDSCAYLSGDIDKNCVVNLFDIFCALDAMAGDDHCSTCSQP